MDKPRPRYVQDISLPVYSYVPGRFPHPLSDPGGHSYGKKPPRPELPDPDQWQSCQEYLLGIDLFNHGYYWEAHEVWEGLWHACGRGGLAGNFLKALIKLAAAGVKVREGMPEGVRSHARRAAQLIESLLENLGRDASFMGLRLEDLMKQARLLATTPPARSVESQKPVEVVFDFVLEPK